MVYATTFALCFALVLHSSTNRVEGRCDTFDVVDPDEELPEGFTRVSEDIILNLNGRLVLTDPALADIVGTVPDLSYCFFVGVVVVVFMSTTTEYKTRFNKNNTIATTKQSTVVRNKRVLGADTKKQGKTSHTFNLLKGHTSVNPFVLLPSTATLLVLAQSTSLLVSRNEQQTIHSTYKMKKGVGGRKEGRGGIWGGGGVKEIGSLTGVVLIVWEYNHIQI